ncbi:MAG: hypothetical protein RLZZ544_1365 [Actinomycetota bacterium]|jgi:hypothetical protein
MVEHAETIGNDREYLQQCLVPLGEECAQKWNTT